MICFPVCIHCLIQINFAFKGVQCAQYIFIVFKFSNQEFYQGNFFKEGDHTKFVVVKQLYLADLILLVLQLTVLSCIFWSYDAYIGQ